MFGFAFSLFVYIMDQINFAQFPSTNSGGNSTNLTGLKLSIFPSN
jgi:hypothetical protein